jgi:hypothetical protein
MATNTTVVARDIDDALATLGVARGAPLADIKRAFRTLCKTHHPDVGGNHARQVALNAAYATLVPWVRQGRPANAVTDDPDWLTARWQEAMRRQEANRAAQAAEQARQEEVRRNTRVYSARETATLLKAALRAAFPGTSFRVTISHPRWRAGAELTVTWEDGPLDADVKAVTDDYEGQEFYDGGGDYLDARDRVLPDGPGTWKRYDVDDITLTRRYATDRCPACGSFQRQKSEFDQSTNTILFVCRSCHHRWPMPR